MFGFHFRVKSSNRKKGRTVSASRHERYILREDEYKSAAQIKKQNKLYKDCLTGKNPNINLPKTERLIYESPFGNIKQDENGIYISSGASVETVAIALSVAEKIYGSSISVRGSDLFREKNVKAASELKLPITFVHRTLAKKCKTEKERIENDRQEFERNGGRYSNPRVSIRRNNENLQEPRTKLRSFRDLAGGRLCLPRLHKWSMDSDPNRSRVFLSSDQISDIRNKHRELSDKVRWDTAPARKRIVEETAANILTNINHSNESAVGHIQYITRDSIFSHKGGCVYVSEHLPKWAKGNSKKFWEMADLFERKNGERYKEIEFSLPNVLNLEAQKKIIEQFIEKNLKNFYYTYAIHDKIGALSDEERHPHVHIMFSPREIDDYERNIERTPDKFFSRYNNKNPEKGGCKKSDNWNDKNRFEYIYKLRCEFAEIENEILEENGIHIKVDPRSFEEQRKRALLNGNELLVKVLNRVPEKYIKEIAKINDEDNPLIKQVKEERQRVKKQIKNIEDKFINEIAEEKIKLSEIWKEIESKRENLNRIYEELPQNLQKSFEKFIKRMNESSTKVMARRSVVIDSSNAFQKAVMDFLDYDAKKSFEKLKKCVEEKREWEYFKKSVQISKGDEKIFEEIKKEIDTNLTILNNKIKKYAKECKPCFDYLAQDKQTHKLIRLQGINYLNEDRIARSDLKKKTFQALRDVRIAERGLRLYLKTKAHANPKTSEDILNNVSGELAKLEMQIRQTQAEIKELEKKVISPQRAIYIAKDVFTKGAFKKIRQDKRSLEKKKSSLSKILYDKAKKDILEKEKNLIVECGLPENDVKIKNIAAGILKKNEPIKNSLVEKKKFLSNLENEKNNLQKSYREIIKKKDDTNLYKIGNIKNNYLTPKLETHILANAIAKLSGKDEKWANLVMYAKHDNLDDWNLLSETEKDDILAHQAMDRY